MNKPRYEEFTEDGVSYVKEDGMSYVKLPVAEYHALLERAWDAEDLQAIHQTKQSIAEGEEPLPLALTKRILSGEHPVKVLREHRTFTQTQLAAASGINRVYISEIENGKKRGSVTAMKALAEALKVPLDELV